MKLLNGHLDLNAKSLGTIAGSAVGIALAWGYLTPDKAAAVSTAIAAVSALVVPDREAGAK